MSTIKKYDSSNENSLLKSLGPYRVMTAGEESGTKSIKSESLLDYLTFDVYFPSIKIDFITELMAWDIVSDEALANFEANLVMRVR